MKEYLKSTEDVLNELDSTENGLTTAEAEKRLLENGKNKLDEGKKQSIIVRFLKQLAEPMTIILLVAAGISAAIELPHFPTDTVIILAVVLLNAILYKSLINSSLFSAVTPLQNATSISSSLAVKYLNTLSL